MGSEKWIENLTDAISEGLDRWKNIKIKLRELQVQ
jgi:hypothetical protein